VSDIVTTTLFLSAVRLTVPVLLAAVGGLVAERAGVINIALEGQMLVGAFTGVAVTWWTGHLLVGLAAAVTAGALAGGLHAAFAVRLGADQIVVGTAWNLVAVGATSALVPAIWGAPGASAGVSTLRPVDLPVLPDLTMS
jgi:simple sugar transport system permease protein